VRIADPRTRSGGSPLQLSAASMLRSQARKANERLSLDCPVVLGIDEHTLHKKKQFATTFCDLGKRRIFDTVQGKAATDLEGFLSHLNGRERFVSTCVQPCAVWSGVISQTASWWPPPLAQ
jgi:hypothetical protein